MTKVEFHFKVRCVSTFTELSSSCDIAGQFEPLVQKGKLSMPENGLVVWVLNREYQSLEKIILCARPGVQVSKHLK